MAGKNSDVGIRLSAEGREEVIAALRSIGPEGEAMAQRLLRAGKDSSRGLLAINEAASQVKDRAVRLSDELGPLGSVLRTIGPGGLAAAAGLGLVALGAAKAFEQARKGMEFADAVQSASERLRFGVEALQEYRLALVIVGDESANFDAGISVLLQKMGEFDRTGGGGKAGGVFKQLGLSVRNATGEMKTGEEMLGELIAKVSQLGSEAQQADIAKKLFGGQAANFLNLMQQGTDGVARMREEMRAMGAIMDVSVIEKYAEAEKQAKLLSRAIDVQMMQAFVDFAPILNDAAGAWARLARGIAKARDLWVDLDQVTERGLMARQGELVEERNHLEGLIARRGRWTEEERQEVKKFGGSTDGAIQNMQARIAKIDAAYARVGPRPKLGGDLTLDEGVSDAAVKSAEQNVEVLRRLKDEIANFGNERQKFVDSRMAGLSADASPQVRAQTEAYANALFDLNEEKAVGNKLDEEANRLLKEGEALRKSVMTDAEKYAEIKADLNQKLATTAITQETYNRALQRAGEEYDPAIRLSKDLSEQIARTGLHAASTIHNIDDLADAVADLGQQILETILNAVAYAPIQSAVQAGLSSFMPSIFGSVRHAGGIGSGGPGRSVPASVFAQAPRFHDGIGPNEMAAIITRDEGVFTPRQMDNADNLFRQMAGMVVNSVGGGGRGEMSVRIFKQPGTDVEATQGRDAAGSPTLDVIVKKVSSMMASEIGVGRSPINGAMESRYPALKNARALPRNG